MNDEINIIEAPDFDNKQDFGKKRIGILCLRGLETFIKPIAANLKEKYEVREYYGNSIPEMESVIDFCDLLWVEWMNELCINISKLPSVKDKKVIVRCHSYEALAGYVNYIDFSNIDCLLFVAPHIKDLVLKQAPRLPEFVEIHTVFNGV